MTSGRGSNNQRALDNLRPKTKSLSKLFLIASLFATAHAYIIVSLIIDSETQSSSIARHSSSSSCIVTAEACGHADAHYGGSDKVKEWLALRGSRSNQIENREKNRAQAKPHENEQKVASGGVGNGVWAPIRLMLNTTFIDSPITDEEEQKGRQACVNVGDKVQLGPLGSGTPECAANQYFNCYIVCTAADIVTPSKAAKMRSLVQTYVLDYFQGILSVSDASTASPSLSIDVCGMLKNSQANYDNADTAVYISARPSRSPTTLASAFTCHISSVNQRPDAIVINIPPTTLDKAELTEKNLRDVMRHEFTHGLGFSSSLMRYYRHPSDPTKRYYEYNSTAYPKGPVIGNIVTMDTDAGFNVYGPNLNENQMQDNPINKVGLVTPKALAWAREFFGCPSLTMVELENQGGAGGAGSHFEERIYMNELMAPQAKSSNSLTGLTLSLLEDMGWYQVAASAFEEGTIEVMDFGYKAGCAFAEEKCNDRARNPQWPFNGVIQNATSTQTFCTYDYKYVSVGGVVEYGADLPSGGQYFPSNPRLGGAVPQADFCPYVRENNVNGNCQNSSHSYINPQFLGNRAGPSSRCFMAETTAQQSTFYAPSQGLCYETVCTSNTTIMIRIGDEYYPCPDGGKLQIDYQRRDTNYEGPKQTVGPSFAYKTSSKWKALIECPANIWRHICGTPFAETINKDLKMAYFNPPPTASATTTMQALSSGFSAASEGSASASAVSIGTFPYVSSISSGGEAAVGSTITLNGANFETCTAVLLGGMRHAIGTKNAASTSLTVTVAQMTVPYGGYGVGAIGEMDVSLVCTLGTSWSPACGGEGCVIATDVVFKLVAPTTTAAGGTSSSTNGASTSASASATSVATTTTAAGATTNSVGPASTTVTTATSQSPTSSSSSPSSTSAAGATSTTSPPTTNSGGGGTTTVSTTSSPHTSTSGQTIPDWTPASTTTVPPGQPTQPPTPATQCSGTTPDVVPRIYPQSPRFGIRLLPVSTVASGANNSSSAPKSKLQEFLEKSIEIIPPSMTDWATQLMDMTVVNLTHRDVENVGPIPNAHPFLTTLKMKASVWKRNELNLVIDILPTGFTDNERYLVFQFIAGAKSTSVVHTDGPTTIEGTGTLTAPDMFTDYAGGGPNYGAGLTSVARTTALIKLPPLSDLVTYRDPFEAYIVQAATTEIPSVTNATTRFRAGSATSASKGQECPDFKTELPQHSAIVFFRMILTPDEDFDEIVDVAESVGLISGIVSLVSTFLSAAPAFSMMIGRSAALPTLSTCDFATDVKLPFPLMPAEYSVGEGKMRLHRGNIRIILIIYAAWIAVGLLLGIFIIPFVTMSPRLTCLQRLWKAYGGVRMPSLWSVPVFFFALGCILSTTLVTGNLAIGEGKTLSMSSSFIDMVSESSSSSLLGKNPPDNSIYKRAKEVADGLADANANGDGGDQFIPDVVVCSVSFAVHLLFLIYLVVRLTSGFGASALPEEGAGFAAGDAEKKTRGTVFPALKWVNDPEDATLSWNHFAMHYTFYFSAYTEPWQAFILFDYSISILIGILLGVRIEQHCLIISVVYAGLNAILVLGLVVTRPHMTVIAWGLNTAMAIVTTLGGILAVLGIIRRQPENEGAPPDNAYDATRAAIILSMVAMGLIGLKIIHDLVLFVAYCIRGKWRLGIVNDGEQYVDGKLVILGGKDSDDRRGDHHHDDDSVDNPSTQLTRHGSNVSSLPAAPAPILAPLLGRADDQSEVADFFDIAAHDSGNGGKGNSNNKSSNKPNKSDDNADIELEERESEDEFSERGRASENPPPPHMKKDKDDEHNTSLQSEGSTFLETTSSESHTKMDGDDGSSTKKKKGQKKKQVFRETDLTENGLDRNASLKELIAQQASSTISEDDI